MARSDARAARSGARAWTPLVPAALPTMERRSCVLRGRGIDRFESVFGWFFGHLAHSGEVCGCVAYSNDGKGALLIGKVDEEVI